jgi:hypothetical protein
MAQAVIRRPLTAEARVRSRVSPCEICGGQSGTSVFPCQFHSTRAQLLGKMKKKLIIITKKCQYTKMDSVISQKTGMFISASL